MATKPSKNHPWKNGITPAISKWAREQSEITNVQTVLVARSEGLKKKDSRKLEGGLQ